MTSTLTDRRTGVMDGLACKQPCIAATTANITLSGTQTIDGIAVVADDRVLVKNQTTDSQNGIYVVSASAWTRATDFDSVNEIDKGTLVPVAAGGTVNGATLWQVSSTAPTTIDSSSITFGQSFGLTVSSTDNAVVRFDGTSGDMQNSIILIDDNGAICPVTSDTGALGTTTLMWSDLFLASGAVINFNNGDVTITHAANTLSFAGAASGYTFDHHVTLTSTNASALAVGANGATNPVLKVDASTASVATGVSITGAAAASRAALAVLSSGTDEGLSIDAKGAGTVRLGATSTGAIEFSRNAVPTASDGAALGTTALMWSDLFLASGAVLNFNNGDVTVTHAANALAFAGASSGYTFDATVSPAANDGGALGTASLMWSDLFLASGAVVNFNNGDVTITHSANTLAFAGASTGYTFDAPVSNTSGETIYSGTAVPAGGTTGVGYKMSSTSNLGIFFGSGAPTLSAAQGSIYIRTDGSSTSTRLYINTNGVGTWTAVTTAA